MANDQMSYWKLELADLCAYPIQKYFVYGTRDKAFETLLPSSTKTGWCKPEKRDVLHCWKWTGSYTLTPNLHHFVQIFLQRPKVKHETAPKNRKMIYDGSPEEKPRGCFHLGDKQESACGACTSMHSTGNVQRLCREILPKSGTDEGGVYEWQ